MTQTDLLQKLDLLNDYRQMHHDDAHRDATRHESDTHVQKYWHKHFMQSLSLLSPEEIRQYILKDARQNGFYLSHYFDTCSESQAPAWVYLMGLGSSPKLQPEAALSVLETWVNTMGEGLSLFSKASTVGSRIYCLGIAGKHQHVRTPSWWVFCSLYKPRPNPAKEPTPLLGTVWDAQTAGPTLYEQARKDPGCVWQLTPSPEGGYLAQTLQSALIEPQGAYLVTKQPGPRIGTLHLIEA